MMWERESCIQKGSYELDPERWPVKKSKDVRSKDKSLLQSDYTTFSKEYFGVLLLWCYISCQRGPMPRWQHCCKQAQVEWKYEFSATEKVMWSVNLFILYWFLFFMFLEQSGVNLPWLSGPLMSIFSTYSDTPLLPELLPIWWTEPAGVLLIKAIISNVLALCYQAALHTVIIF